MKRPFHIFLFLLLTLTISAQDEYLKGRDFWTTSSVLSYDSALFTSSPQYDILYLPDTCVLYVMGDTVCNGYVENPNTGFYQTFAVTPGVLTKLKIPSEHGMWALSNQWTNPETSRDTIFPSGIHVATSHSILLYQLCNMPRFVNAEGGLCTPMSNQKLRVLPMHLYGSNHSHAQHHDMGCVVIATEDSSLVTIRVAGNVESQRILRKGETLILKYSRNIAYRTVHIESSENEC